MTGQERKIVVLGMMTNMPVPGVVWQTLHYLEGLRRLGFDVYYVEAHARSPSMFVGKNGDDGARAAADFIHHVMERFGFPGKWAFHALHSDGRCYGMSTVELERLYASAEVLINLHGGTAPLEEHAATGRLLFLGTDPARLEVELFHVNRATIEILDAHTWHFTFAENYRSPDCSLPVTDLFDLQPTRQPVLLDWWERYETPGSGLFTTVGNWRQGWRDIRFLEDTYRWSKHHEFLKFLDLPARTGQRFELALSSIGDDGRKVLHEHGWLVRDAHELDWDVDGYRDYIGTSRGEYTVAKDQNVRLRSGWFSDRSATYLATGRPVITQDTGFGNVLPVGKGLFAFSTLDEAVAAVEEIEADYSAHRRGALQVARAYFAAELVLGSLLVRAGISLPRKMAGRVPHASSVSADAAVPPALSEGGLCGILRDDLPIQPVRRCPTELDPHVLRDAELAPPPVAYPEAFTNVDSTPTASIVMATFDKLPFTKLCVESVLAHTRRSAYELIIVDNGSEDGTRAYLAALRDRFPHVDVVFNDRNMGFAAANNIGLARARGEVLVLLNNDTIVPPGWLEGLTPHLEGVHVGAVGPVTNRICNEAQIETRYDTYGAFRDFADWRRKTYRELRFALPVLAMFCFAMKRRVFEDVGPLDERFGLGTFEDDDYSLRIREIGMRLVCAEDVFVHHFGEASFGDLVATGEYQRLLVENRRQLEDKWGVPWEPHGRRESDAYRRTKERIRQIVAAQLPRSATVAVVSRGDDELLSLEGRRGWHVPRTPSGEWAGWYPEGSREAIEAIETLRAEGADYLLIPDSSRWWLEFYQGLRQHLDSEYLSVVQEPGVCTVFSLRVPEAS